MDLDPSSSGAPTSSRPISLSDAIASGAPLSWTETVAVVREVAMHLHWSATPLNVPSLGQISILPNGSVQVEGGRPNTAGPVVGLATLMEQLLDSTACPQQLLDVQKQARATPPVFASPQALHAALEYFARPGAQDELAAYYKAASVAMDATAKNRELEALKEKTKASLDPENKKKKAKPRSRVLMYAAFAFVGLTGVGAALFWMRYGGQAPAVMNQSAGAALDAIATTGKDITAAASTMVSEMVGAPREPTPPPPTPPPAPPVIAPKPRPRGTRDANARPVPGSPAERQAAIGPFDPEVASLPSTTDPEPEAPPIAVDERIYSGGDAEVKAPELTYPQLPKQYNATVPNSRPGLLDILVLEDGSVGEVRLRPDSNRLQDRMLVSAAKAWQFRPATRNGRPVKYRLMIPITY
jgi:protein TonB